MFKKGLGLVIVGVIFLIGCGNGERTVSCATADNVIPRVSIRYEAIDDDIQEATIRFSYTRYQIMTSVLGQRGLSDEELEAAIVELLELDSYPASVSYEVDIRDDSFQMVYISIIFDITSLSDAELAEFGFSTSLEEEMREMESDPDMTCRDL